MKTGKNRRKIPLFDLKLGSATRKEVADTLSSGWLTTGPKVAAFEKRAAKLLKVDHVAAVGSCTTGLQLTLTAIGAAGREVITTPFTFVATIGAILAVGARPVLADINPATLNIDPDEVRRKVSDRTAAVLPVDIAGYMADYEQLNAICDRRSVPLIADAAHSIGAAYRNNSVPVLTDAAVFSFYSTKNLTCGEGGMVVSRHEALIDVVKRLSRHGLTSNTHSRKQSGTWQYDVTRQGFKANMSDVHAAIGLGQMTVFRKDQQRRKKIAERYLKNLADLPDLLELPIVQKYYRHGWHLFIIRLHLSALKIDRDKFIRLMAARGIDCGVHYQPIFEFSYYQNQLGLSPQYFPNAAYAGKRVVSLPMYPHLTMSEVDYVCQCTAEILKKHARRQ